MSNDTAIATAPKTSLVAKFANKYNIEPDKLLATLKATCFKLSVDKSTGEMKQVTNEQMVALLIVADQYGLNPFTKEIFAFEDKNKGVVPVVSVDGWSRIINSHRDIDGIEFRFADEMNTPSGGKACPIWCEVSIYHKGRSRPTTVREYLDEVYVAPRNGYSGPWQTHTKRFLRHKTFIQGGRIAFGFGGIYDEDEARRIIEGSAIDVTPQRITNASNVSNLQQRLENSSDLPPIMATDTRVAEPVERRTSNDPFTDADEAGGGDETSHASEN